MADTLVAAPPRRIVAVVWLWPCLVAAVALAALLSLGIGRYSIPLTHVLGIIGSWLLPGDVFWTETEARVVTLVRLPRVLMALIGGAGLAIAGAALQGIFRNPLVAPHILGVSSGAAFGGVIGILLHGGGAPVVVLAFVFGMVAMAVVFWLSRVGGRSNVLALVLAGIVVGALFSALVSLITFVADPYDKLPAIVFWLMGSFAAATHAKLVVMAVPVILGIVLLHLMRWRINVLSLGDEEAQALGLKVERTRWLVLVCVTAITAAVVSVSGVIGWVGLVIPHLARMMVGPDHRVLLPASALLGGIYLLGIDDLARTMTASEIPIGILTAIVGAPVFAWLLKRGHSKGWGHA